MDKEKKIEWVVDYIEPVSGEVVEDTPYTWEPADHMFINGRVYKLPTQENVLNFMGTKKD